MCKKLNYYFRRMKYLAWVEWQRIIRDKPLPLGAYLVSQRDLTKEEYDYADKLADAHGLWHINSAKNWASFEEALAKEKEGDPE